MYWILWQRLQELRGVGDDVGVAEGEVTGVADDAEAHTDRARCRHPQHEAGEDCPGQPWALAGPRRVCSSREPGETEAQERGIDSG